MRVFITGATGYVGEAVALAFVRAGHSVRALARSQAAAERLRALALVPVLVPLTVGTFRRADELAEAMESRGNRGGEGRTRYRELRFRARDALALAVTQLILLAGVLA